jgi:pyridoxal phosphate enzyme (YggS family)
VAGLDPDRVRANLAAVQEEVGPGVTVLAAVKYVELEDMPALVEAGVRTAGENRAQELQAKAAAHPELDWHFIGHLQSRKVATVLPLVSLVHSVASDSVLARLERHGQPDTRVLVQVNVAGEEGKDGVAPADLDAFLERCPVEVAGLMTMPPYAEDPEESRRWFAALRELAHARGLRELSMGTTQDYAVAAQEGATIVRVGSRLYA